VRADGTAGLVGVFGTALGLLESITSSVFELRLAPGDALVFYTDGVTERRGGAVDDTAGEHQTELFGPRRLCEAASRLAGLPADAIAAGLRAAALGFGAEPPRDDLAVLTIRNDGPPGTVDPPTA
jgi:serine phosphatase RsbU (regulator of sigma subunit)